MWARPKSRVDSYLSLVHEVEEKSEVIGFNVPQQDDWVGMVIEQTTQPTVASTSIL